MSEIKERFYCGDCEDFESCRSQDSGIDKDTEACSDIEPKEGWRE